MTSRIFLTLAHRLAILAYIAFALFPLFLKNVGKALFSMTKR